MVHDGSPPSSIKDAAQLVASSHHSGGTLTRPPAWTWFCVEAILWSHAGRKYPTQCCLDLMNERRSGRKIHGLSKQKAMEKNRGLRVNLKAIQGESICINLCINHCYGWWKESCTSWYMVPCFSCFLSHVKIPPRKKNNSSAKFPWAQRLRPLGSW